MELNDITKNIKAVSDKYAKNCGINRDKDWHLLKIQEELGELTQQHLKLSGRGRASKTPEEHRKLLEEEVADVFAHVLLYAHNNDINIEKAVKDKWFTWLEK